MMEGVRRMIIVGVSDGAVLAGSVKYSCTWCTRTVWLTRANQERVRKEPETKICCLHCFATNTEIPKMTEFMGNREELEALYGERTDEMLAKGEKLLRNLEAQRGKATEPWRKN
ncbi:MAG: hypothetical protein JO028_18040 [Acidobacteriaceae bacterium]|nr:hypothetical protein [Acidobacteriaceae bacterium]